MDSLEKQDLVKILQWHIDNGIDEIINEEPTDHFKLYLDKKSKKNPTQKTNVNTEQTTVKSSVNHISNTIEQATTTQKSVQKTQINIEVKTKIEEKSVTKVEIKKERGELFANHSSMTLQQALEKLEIKNRALMDKKNKQQETNIMTPMEAMELSKKIANDMNTLEELEESIKNFEGCQLKQSATNTVFSDGCKDSKVLILGEAPGNNEDLQGIPFCGQSGQLLDNMFASINLERSKNLYITNTLFWRPPGNRRPTKEELEICRPFVEKHIALINPELIITTGSTAMSLILGEKISITKSRGTTFEYKNDYMEVSCKAIPFFHPAYLMRQPTKKREAWKDLLFIKDIVEERA